MVEFIIYMITLGGIYCILSLSLNFQYGFCGLANFGLAGFFCIGAYTSALIVTWLEIPVLISILISMIITGLFSGLLALPTGRLRSDYWGIATLAASEIIRLFFNNEAWVAKGKYNGGPYGIRGIPGMFDSIISPDFRFLSDLIVVIVFVLFTLITLNILIKSPFGRVVKSLREEDDLAISFGKNVVQFKLLTMIIGGAFIGLAGSLYSHFMEFISPESFRPIETFFIWAMVALGGVGNLWGAIVGAFVLHFIFTGSMFLKDLFPVSGELIANLRLVGSGFLIIFIMLFMRNGLIKEKPRIY